MEEMLRFRHNPMEVSSVQAFEQTRGGVCQNIKNVCFVRLLGDNGTLLHDIEQMDDKLSAKMAQGRCVYQRIQNLPGLSDPDKAEYYACCYQAWKQSGEKSLETKASVKTGIPKDVLAWACGGAVKALAGSKSAFSDSMGKNFAVKLLFWLDQVLKGFSQNWKETLSIKIVSHDVARAQEYCFFYFLTLLGIDVLLLQCRQDIDPKLESLGLSESFRLGEWTEHEFPAYDVERYSAAAKTAQAQPSFAKDSQEPVRIHLPQRDRQAKNRLRQPEQGPVRISLPERNRPGKSQTSAQIKTAAKTMPQSQAHSQRQPLTERREKTFEELALLASSVVLVGIHDRQGELIGTGSGIMIGRKGYILTNNHVASGGCFYTVRIEEDENVYETEEGIKYNQVLDLAVLRIERKLQPLPVYSGRQKLVRGQRVVAIGSPLGLFNSVSDGIISGFRVIDDVDMIQFTAPTSRGSSGGALLNMYGEVIGISTAGMDRGQNINLAVGYEGINMFIQGFTG